MSEHPGSSAPRVAKWPFFLGDLLLVAVAVICYAQGQHWPFGSRVGLAPWEGWVLTACVFLGAGLGALPFLLEYRAWVQWSEIDRVQAALQQFRNAEQVGRQIASATSCWQAVQDDSTKAVEAARGLQERMTGEARAFQEFLEKANDSERAHLRLEVEKLRRAETDWLQVLVRLLDHVWYVYQAAVRSGKVNLVEQLSLFQRACRDAALRVGLVPFVAKAGDQLDPALHEAVREIPPELKDPKVAETVATGYRFQGQLIRKVLVLVAPPVEPKPLEQMFQPGELGSESPAEFMPVGSVEGGIPQPSDEGPTEIFVAPQKSNQPVEVPSGSGDTEFTRRMATGFQQSADTEFVRQLRKADVGEEKVEGEVTPTQGGA